jgi:hypothetical protein
MRKPSVAALAALLAAGATPSPAASWSSMTRRQLAAELTALHRAHPELEDRVDAVSAGFLGTPYKLGPLGEGPTGEFDRGPLITFKALDCTTYVEEALALSLASDLPAAEALLQRIRYKDGVVSYETRNHFPEVDWLPNNETAGFLRDVTREIGGNLTRTATKTISKRDWYAHKTLADMHGLDALGEAEKKRRLARLQTVGASMPDVQASVDYVPAGAISSVLDKLPRAAVANIVREDQPGKVVLISHQILIIDKAGVKYARHAAGANVHEEPLLDLVNRFSGYSWKFLGLNIDAILPKN